MANSCSHRASQIVTGSGNTRRLRCPFHAWTYDLDGRLVAAPEMHRTVGFGQSMGSDESIESGAADSAPDDLCLTRYGTAERDGFAFVTVDPDAPPIDDWLGDFSKLHAPWRLDTLATARRREFTVDCNWKAFAEVFNEYYHIPYVHPDSIDDIYLEPDEPENVTGAYATHFGLTDGTGGLLADDTDEADKILPTMPGLDGRPGRGVRYSWIFPNLVIATGAEALWMYEVYPDGPDRCRCAQVVALPPSSFEVDDFDRRTAAYYERFDVALDEDIPALERQHQGQRSPHAKQGRYSYLEPSVARFGSWYAERLLTVL